MTYVSLASLMPSAANRDVKLTLRHRATSTAGFRATSLSYNLGVRFFASRTRR
jgi:hypothetical protein